jgi:sugar diacid utilization regulator
MLRVYLLKLQNKEKTQKLKILARLQTSENTQLIKTLSFFKKQNLSWGVFFLYSLFF